MKLNSKVNYITPSNSIHLESQTPIKKQLETPRKTETPVFKLPATQSEFKIPQSKPHQNNEAQMTPFKLLSKIKK